VNGTLTLGIVGHVDHGKTALVRALTGIDTDRLKEERERGLSIVLGFAFLETEHAVVDLIDVPGHEDFIRAMIAGATALDGIVLCVAANEGVMPQTVEHFNIARLLEVDRGLVVITKTDLVDREKLASVKAEVERFVRHTFLEGAPVIEFSAVSGDGLAAVREALARLAARPVEREASGAFFLPLDRVFTIRGFGLVATGTLRGGPLGTGDAVEVMPARKASSVRALQNHGRPIDRAVPGMRVAVNLRQLSRDEVERGAVLAAPGSVVPTRRLDAELRLLEDAQRGVANGAVLRFLTGTTEASARVRLLDSRELAPGESAMAQINLDRDVATRSSERFLLRTQSPMRTIGGGRILDVNAVRHKRFDPSVKARLETRASGDLERIVEQRLEEAGGAGIGVGELAATLGAQRDAIAALIARLGAQRIGDDIAVGGVAYERLLTGIVAAVERFHREQPLKKGLGIASLAKELGAGVEIVHCALKELSARGKVQLADELVSGAGYDPFARLGERERQLVTEIERAFLSGGLEPQAPEAIVGSSKPAQVIYGLLLETGRLVRLRTYDRHSTVVLHARTLDEAKHALARKFPYPRPFAVKDARDLLGSTRKHVVPLLEHFDAAGVTVRSGDQRRLREV
jgi:selenocysteine-specific elongation factor